MQIGVQNKLCSKNTRLIPKVSSKADIVTKTPVLGCLFFSEVIKHTCTHVPTCTRTQNKYDLLGRI